MVSQAYTISTVKNTVPPRVKMSQYDTGSRTIVFSVVDGSGTAVDLTGLSVTVEGTRIDGHAFAAACTVDDNTASFTESVDMTNVAGDHPAELVIRQSGQRLGTMNFILSVEAAAMDENASITPEDESLFNQLYGSVDDAIAEVDGAKDDALQEIAQGLASGAPLTANTVAAMTDTDAVYLYTGSESGYTAGSWYYYNGTAWVVGGVYGAGTTDTTLSLSGVAADAKATGERIEQLEGALTPIPSKNMYNPAAILDGMWITGTGELISQPDYGGYVTEVIAAESGRTLFLSMLNNGSRTAATFTRARTLANDGTTVKRVLPSASTVTIASDESYIQFLFANAQQNVYLQIEYDGITAYEPYTEGYEKTATQAELDDVAVPIDKYFPVTDSINLIDPTKWQDGKWINAGGSIVSNDYGGTVIVVNVDAGKHLYLTYNDNPQSFLSTVRYATYGADDSVISVNTGSINGFEIGANVAYVAICVGVASKATHPCLSYDMAYGYIPYFASQRTVNVSEIFNHVFISARMFNSIGAVGDSYTLAASKNSSGNWTVCANQAYVAVLGQSCGVEYANYGVSGANTRTYQTDQNGLAAVLSDTAKDFYFLALGINDSALGSQYLGSISDIHDSDYTLNADTFYGNYGKIIAQIKAHAPNAKFCMAKLALRSSQVADDFCDAVANIANHYGFPVIDQYDDDFFFSTVWANKNDSHPTPMSYVGMALAYERLLSKAIMQNPGYFEFSTIG